MKRAFASILLLIYFTVTTGFSLSVHYCMDRFDSTQLGTSGDDKCEKCGMHKDGGCCRDEVKVVKLQTSHLATLALTPDFSLPVAQLINTDFLLTPFINHTEKISPVDHGPPPIGPDIYLQIRVFRI